MNMINNKFIFRRIVTNNGKATNRMTHWSTGYVFIYYNMAS